ncbi:AMP-binding protein [Rhodococcus opacus]|uniref:AMP-binding protein n=1 Tax=Rhodococcus opacus TaxID=37919 RepID=UPI00155AD0C6|nr:AMP-binding protein [Rhodococcus opacus]
MDMNDYLADVRERQAIRRPPNTPGEVTYPVGEITIPEHIAHWAELTPDRIAISHEGREMRYSDLDGIHRRVAGWLRDAGVRPGDRVGVHLGNGPEFVIAFLAVLRLGAVHVPINPMFRPGEFTTEINDSGARLVITTAASHDVVVSAWETIDIDHVVVIGDVQPAGIPVTSWKTVTAHEPYDGCETDLDALAALNYTGGTTGLPKGCMHTQRHMLYTAVTGTGGSGMHAGDDYVAVCFLPIFWIGGENLGILFPLVLGGTVVLMSRWDPTAVMEAIDRYRATTMVGNVENYLELLDHPDRHRYELSSLRDPQAVSFVGKLTPDLRHRWANEVGGGALRECAYGMTETHTMDVLPYGLADGDEDLLAEPIFCGLPVPGTDIAVVSFEDGKPLPLGEVGEIIVRSPAVMTGYWRNPEATSQQLVDGWLHTGDHGRLDDAGFLHYLGRTKEMIKVKGMSVFPAEVEVILGRHPDISAVAVVAVEDPDTGQRPLAFVQRERGASIGPDAIQSWARTQMATYKVPAVRMLDEFPMTPTGKIRKNVLQQEVTNSGIDR